MLLTFYTQVLKNHNLGTFSAESFHFLLIKSYCLYTYTVIFHIFNENLSFVVFLEQGQQNLTQHQHPASSIYSTSTPELNRINLAYHHGHGQMPANGSVYQMHTQDQIIAELQRLNLYKPPPPYPGTNNANGQHQHGVIAPMGLNQVNGTETRMVSSTSTPDLASTNIMSAMNASHSGVFIDH